MTRPDVTKHRVVLPDYKWETVLNLVDAAAARVNKDGIKKSYLMDLADHIRNQIQPE